MKRFFTLIMFLFLKLCVSAQVYDGYPMDSVMIHFTDTTYKNFIFDTASTPLWQIGRTHKTFFTTDSSGTVAMMTDTANFYPPNADNSFTIYLSQPYANVIIDFWHRYETDSGFDGGLVEFSTDHRATWHNIKGGCNRDSLPFEPGIHTSNFYAFNDTLITGQPAFTGIRSIGRFSRFQFFVGLPLKTSSGVECFVHDTLFIRFRFLSDTTLDSFASWIIDSMKIEHDRYEGAVYDIHESHALHVIPNPSNTGTFTFPSLKNEQLFTLEVYNSLAQNVLNAPYNHIVDISHFPKGLYFYNVTDGTEYYSGRLLYE